jgi:hypothetical protein
MYVCMYVCMYDEALGCCCVLVSIRTQQTSQSIQCMHECVGVKEEGGRVT